jgi:hypothetical protein
MMMILLPFSLREDIVRAGIVQGQPILDLMAVERKRVDHASISVVVT